MRETSLIITSFFIYSLIGWIWETIVCSFHEKKFVYRGFLNGPYCPIYGFGALAFIYLASPFQFSPFALFIAGTAIASILEYFTSFALEKAFSTKWWDYSDHKFNLNGRISLIPSLFWGFLSLILIYFVDIPIHNFGENLYNFGSFWIALIISAILLGDFIYTIFGLIGLKKLMLNLSIEIEKYKDHVRWTLDDYAKFLAEQRKKSRLRFIERRTLRGFPKLTNVNLPDLQNKKETLLAADKSQRKIRKNSKK